MGVAAVGGRWPRLLDCTAHPTPLARGGPSRTVLWFGPDRTSTSGVSDRPTAPDLDAAEMSGRRMDSHVRDAGAFLPGGDERH
jgi:hypothetical protein